jgi:hypothetical protein
LGDKKGEDKNCRGKRGGVKDREEVFWGQVGKKTMDKKLL